MIEETKPEETQADGAGAATPRADEAIAGDDAPATAAVSSHAAGIPRVVEAPPVESECGGGAAASDEAVEPTPGGAPEASAEGEVESGAAGAPAESEAAPASSGPKHPDMKWYVVTTYSGFETKARQALEERVRSSDLADLFGEILVPTEPPPEGKKRPQQRSFFPGYIFVEMVMDERTWALVRATPKVTNFVGSQRPSPVPAREIEQIRRQIAEGAIKPKPMVTFEEGDRVRVNQGPFANMVGTVSFINQEKQKIRALVLIFGRPTSVELEYGHVERVP